MKYLIDTHVCLWAVAESHKLSSTVKDILENPEHIILYSQVSLFEIAIKFKTGKLPDFKITLDEFNIVLQQKGFTFQPLTNEHLSFPAMSLCIGLCCGKDIAVSKIQLLKNHHYKSYIKANGQMC